MAKHEVPSSISQPLGALYVLDAAEQMIQGCRVNNEKDQFALAKICKQLENIRTRQLVEADKAFSEQFK
jgi:hypothetical protein